MTSDTRSPKEIEREIEDQRSDLTANLEGLQDKFSIDTVVRQIGDQFREHGGDMGRSISEQVKANPIPLALTGLGLAWLMFGSSKKTATEDYAAADRYSAAEHDFRRSQMQQGRPYVAPSYSTSRGDDDPSWARDYDDQTSDIADRIADSADVVRSSAVRGSAAVKDATSRGIDAVKDATNRGTQAASDATQATSSTVSETASSAKSTLTGAATQAKNTLATASNRIAEGTENLSDEGRQRVIDARQKAVALRRKAARSTQDGVDAVSEFYEQQPLVVGALALAFGAALGGALPRTKAEDNLMGGHSDNLFEEAERVFEEEKSKALSVAKSVKDEVKDIAAETKADFDSGAQGNKSAVDAVGDKAKAAASRVAETAKASAKSEKLGKPKT